MKKRLQIVLVLAFAGIVGTARLGAQQPGNTLHFDFYGNQVSLQFSCETFPVFNGGLSQASLESFRNELNNSGLAAAARSLGAYRRQFGLNDWLYYQLIRKTAQQISPKAANYFQYTLYKWYLLTASGYDARLRFTPDKLLFYVRSDDSVFNVPFVLIDEKQFVCLNYHDYGYQVDFENSRFETADLPVTEATGAFSYRISSLPRFSPAAYTEKELRFTRQGQVYSVKIKINPEIKTIFANYPVVDYESYMNIPLSSETYNSLIPQLKQQVAGMSQKEGVDYLMHFTRSAFMFRPDTELYGMEKRLSPEQTLLFDESDCEDRTGLFFALVKEIYNLPMIVLAYPEHVTAAVKFDKPVGKPIIYNGMPFTICEPTPQKKDLSIGQAPPSVKNAGYEVAYAYIPGSK